MDGTTQGDSAAMAIYAIAVKPMILMLVEISFQGNSQQHTLMISLLLDQLTNLRNSRMNYADFVQNLVIMMKEVNPG